MPVLSKYAKQRIVALKGAGLNNRDIVSTLRQEEITTSLQTVRRFHLRYLEDGTINRRAGSGRRLKLDESALAMVEQLMRQDDETTATQIFSFLMHNGVDVSLTTILRGRRTLGWTFHGSAYCQLIREVNKQKRLEWAQLHLHDNFHDVIWTDETTVQLQSHKRYCCRKAGERPRLKPRPKHPVKVHVWAGISWNGPTDICIFEGRMNASLYVQILQNALLPSLQRDHLDGHRFMQDNDPKHTSSTARTFFENNGINWWKTPPESPDANPIENLWHELKEYIRREVKPKTKEDLIRGIQNFWATVDTPKCRRYIHHLQKVLPCIIQLQGNATGY